MPSQKITKKSGSTMQKQSPLDMIIGLQTEKCGSYKDPVAKVVKIPPKPLAYKTKSATKTAWRKIKERSGCSYNKNGNHTKCRTRGKCQDDHLKGRYLLPREDDTERRERKRREAEKHRQSSSSTSNTSTDSEAYMDTPPSPPNDHHLSLLERIEKIFGK